MRKIALVLIIAASAISAKSQSAPISMLQVMYITEHYAEGYALVIRSIELNAKPKTEWIIARKRADGSYLEYVRKKRTIQELEVLKAMHKSGPNRNEKFPQTKYYKTWEPPKGKILLFIKEEKAST